MTMVEYQEATIFTANQKASSLFSDISVWESSQQETASWKEHFHSKLSRTLHSPKSRIHCHISFAAAIHPHSNDIPLVRCGASKYSLLHCDCRHTALEQLRRLQLPIIKGTKTQFNGELFFSGKLHVKEQDRFQSISNTTKYFASPLFPPYSTVWLSLVHSTKLPHILAHQGINQKIKHGSYYSIEMNNKLSFTVIFHRLEISIHA